MVFVALVLVEMASGLSTDTIAWFMAFYVVGTCIWFFRGWVGLLRFLEDHDLAHGELERLSTIRRAIWFSVVRRSLFIGELLRRSGPQASTERGRVSLFGRPPYSEVATRFQPSPRITPIGGHGTVRFGVGYEGPFRSERELRHVFGTGLPETAEASRTRPNYIGSVGWAQNRM